MTRTNRSAYYSGLLFILSLTLAGPAAADPDFRNQFAVFGNNYGGNTEAERNQRYVDIAKQFGYEWVLGDPWSEAKAAAAANAGLGVIFNSNNHAAKWIRFNNPGTEAAPLAPTTVNVGIGPKAISPDLYAEFEKTLCMTEAGRSMPANVLWSGSAWKYFPDELSGGTVIFRANHLSAEGIALNVAANLRTRTLQETKADRKIYKALFLDEATYPPNIQPNCRNPINGAQGDPATYELGQKRFIKEMREGFMAALAADGVAYRGMSLNPYSMFAFDPEHNDPNITADLYYSESGGTRDCDTIEELEAAPAGGCGTQNPQSTRWGSWVMPVDKVAVQIRSELLTPTNYRASQLIAGRAAWQGIWFGWYGGIRRFANNAADLFAAIPNWDNRLGVPLNQRSWNETTNVYHSPNSHIDNAVAYGRRWTDGRLFVVWNTNTAPVVLRSGENVVSAKCVDSAFIETTDCLDHLTVSGTTTKTITLKNAANQLKGYILTLSSAGPNPAPAKPRGLRFQ